MIINNVIQEMYIGKIHVMLEKKKFMNVDLIIREVGELTIAKEMTYMKVGLFMIKDVLDLHVIHIQTQKRD